MRFRIAAAAGLLILILAAVAGYALWQQKQQRIARERAEAERKAKAAQAAAAVISIPGKIQARNVVNIAPPIACFCRADFQSAADLQSACRSVSELRAGRSKICAKL